MALAGPQIGGVSLIAHIAIIAIFATKKRFNKLFINLQKGDQKSDHPSHPNAK